jgi:hypothetical protein
VDVLAACIHAAEVAQRAGVFGHHGDLHTNLFPRRRFVSHRP